MRKILFTLLALTGLLAAAQSAQAAPVQGELKVNAYGKGFLVGPGIDCGQDCTETATWDDSGPAPTITVTAAASAPGYAVTSWSGCSSLPVMAQCRIEYKPNALKTVSAYFHDVAAPSVFISGYSTWAGETLHVDTNISDNDAVSEVEFLLNGEVVLTKTGDYATVELDTSEIPEGKVVLQVRARDRNHNIGQSNTHVIPVDHTPPALTLDQPLSVTNAAEAAFTFSSDEDYWSGVCEFRKDGEVRVSDSCGPGEPFTAAVPEEGNWEFVVELADGVSNVNRVVHPFVVDRTAPEASFTAGPEDGARVPDAPVAFAWTANDGLPVSQKCAWDGGEATPCENGLEAAPGPGQHSFTVELADQAGNLTSLSRTFTVVRTPDPADRKPPVVRIVAPNQKLGGLGKKLRLNVRCNEACSGKVIVKSKSGLKFSGRVVLSRAGLAKLRLRPNAKVRNALKRLAVRRPATRSVVLTADATLRDKAGNTGKASLRFKVRR